MQSIEIAASILNADLANLERVAQCLNDSGADLLHFDVMDGRFVPNLTFGAPVLAAMAKFSRLPVDVHLMVEEPLELIDAFVRAGADYITFHLESRSDPVQTLAAIHAQGIRGGVVLKPGTDWTAARSCLQDCDMVLVMTVEPGFGGQAFLPQMLPKIAALRSYLDTHNPACRLEVDGGIAPATAAQCIRAGADTLVAGSYLFRAQDIAAAVQSLRPAAESI